MAGRSELLEQIARLLDVRLLDPLEVLLEGDDAVIALRRLVRIRAGQWADAMRDGDDVTAVMTGARLIATYNSITVPSQPACTRNSSTGLVSCPWAAALTINRGMSAP